MIIIKKIVHFVVILLFISCNQNKTHQTNKQNSLRNNEELYYYRNFHCFDFVKRCALEILKIQNLDTLIYVTSSEFHGQYEEIHGKLFKINDSIFYVKTYKHLVQRGNGDKPIRFANDTIYFYCDSSFINSNIWIEYMNNQKEQHKIYSTENKFWVNENLFNSNNDRLYLILDYKNPIVNENVEITSKYFDPKFSISFISLREPDDFYIIVNENQVMTLNIGTESHNNLGPIFKLERMKQGTQLPKSRKLYE